MANRDEGERLARLYRRWVRARSRTNARRFGTGDAIRELRLLLLVTPFAVAGFLGRPDNPLVAWVRHVPAEGVAGRPAAPPARRVPRGAGAFEVAGLGLAVPWWLDRIARPIGSPREAT